MINFHGNELTSIRQLSMYRIIITVLLFGSSFIAPSALAQEKNPPPPERAAQEASAKGFSTWDLQALYGRRFREPFVEDDVEKLTLTLENSSGWSWGSSYFFIDYLKSDPADNNATEFYAEWYPSLGIAKVLGITPRITFLKDILITMGVNAGSKSTGAEPLVFLPGLTIDLKIPGFQFFSLGAYAYIDKGRVNGEDNGCNCTTYQITPSWSIPFEICLARFRFDGFIDFIGRHGDCASQILAQPTIKLDLGNFNGNPDKLLIGVEWVYWHHKFGMSDLNETATQGVIMWVF